MNKAFRHLGYHQRKDGTVEPFKLQPYKKPVGAPAPEPFKSFCPKCNGAATVQEAVHLKPYARVLSCVAACGFWTFDTKDRRRELRKEAKRQARQVAA